MAIKLDVSSLLDKFDKIENSSITSALTNSAIVVQNSAKVKCPVDTGQLRNSIDYNVTDTYAEIGTNVDYAPYVEYGTGLFAVNGDGRKDVPWVYQDLEGQWHSTSGQHPQPYLGPALTENVDLIKEVFVRTIEEEIAKNARL